MDITKLFSLIILIAVNISSINSQSFKPSELERYINLYKFFRSSLFSLIRPNSEDPVNMRLARKLNMLQKVVPPSSPFPCNVTGFRSEKPPSSVHQVRPGDIDVIGALGDSLTAGFGLVATDVLQIFMENRGLSWSIGGQGTWRQYITLPNILKEFNPNLIGYSLRDSYTRDRNSQFNPAEGAAISSEIPYMAEILIKRITADKRVNLKKDWKLITVMFGANDFCLDVCFQENKTAFLEQHRKDLITVLRLLRDNLPRTIVNLAPSPEVRKIAELKQPSPLCQYVHHIECYCYFDDRFKDDQQTFIKLNKIWQKIDEEISTMPEFHQNDFTVIFQPFIVDVEIPSISPDLTDWSYMSRDCFHLSQKMNARAANGLWNNMMEKVGNKTTTIFPLFDRFLCPTKENPYIFTNGNS